MNRLQAVVLAVRGEDVKDALMLAITSRVSVGVLKFSFFCRENEMNQSLDDK